MISYDTLVKAIDSHNKMLLYRLLRPYITQHTCDNAKRKEWTEKAIRTREKLVQLEEQVRIVKPSNCDGMVSPIKIISYMVDAVGVSEMISVSNWISVTMLSPKGVDWCNKMWEKVK